MQRLIKNFVSVLAVIAVLLCSVLSCFAKGALSLDDKISVGFNDTVSYTLYLADCEAPVTAMAAYIFYDSDYLEYVKGSVSFHELVAVNRNENIKGYLPFNFSALSSPVDFSEQTPIISLDFKVIKEGASDIKYFISELECGDSENSASVKCFTFTCDYTAHEADGDTEVKNAVPVLLDDKDKMDEFQGSFINYADGKGEQNNGNDEHIAVTGEQKLNAVDVYKEPTDFNTTVIITVSVIVIAILIAIVLILRKVFNPNPAEKSDENGAEEE